MEKAIPDKTKSGTFVPTMAFARMLFLKYTAVGIVGTRACVTRDNQEQTDTQTYQVI